jgi:NACalpha-BTF3-like transcription factor
MVSIKARSIRLRTFDQKIFLWPERLAQKSGFLNMIYMEQGIAHKSRKPLALLHPSCTLEVIQILCAIVKEHDHSSELQRQHAAQAAIDDARLANGLDDGDIRLVMDQAEVPRYLAIRALKLNKADPVDAILALAESPAFDICKNKPGAPLEAAHWALLNCAGDATHAAKALTPGFDGPLSTPGNHAAPWGLASFQGFEERDVDLVAEHAGVSCLAAAWALRDSCGDPSAAVLALARLGLCGGGGAAALLGFCGVRIPAVGARVGSRDSALALAVMTAADFLDVQPALQLLAAAPGALHLAAAAGAAAAVDALLGAGADSGAKDAAGATPLQRTRCRACARALLAADGRTLHAADGPAEWRRGAPFTAAADSRRRRLSRRGGGFHGRATG